MGRWQRFRERQGPALLAVICVAVITGTAVWGKPVQQDDTPLPAADTAPAAQLTQQSLRDVAPPSPTAQPWHSPVAHADVVQPFSGTMAPSGVTGMWRVHEAIDLGCEAGTDIYAMADGTVLDAGQNEQRGAWAVIDHGGGVIVTYAGMKDAVVQAGSKVRAGRVIGHSGAGLWDESDLGPHLHLVIQKDGERVDPAGFLP